ncbi:MAG: lytic transglycosylase domain-containing protein [Phocaeicola sp.]
MKRSHSPFPYLLAALTILPGVLHSSCVSTQKEQEESVKSESKIAIESDSAQLIESTSLPFSSFDIPSRVEFCGQSIDLTRFDRRERMDRELLAFTYMHSTSLQMIKRANRYFPIVEPILKEQGIPDDFKYLMVIESNLNPTALSRAGAAGFWQFMPATGKEHKLLVNELVDERYHIEKSTRAACKYLKTAYAKYGDWITVAKSYNAGQGRISGQLTKQGVEEALDLHLVEETTRYAYRILAAKILFSNPAQMGFRLRAKDLYPPIAYKEIRVTTNIPNLASWAAGQGITYALLRNLNPWLRSTSLTVAAGSSFLIKIPTQEGMHYDPNQTVPHDKAWVIE